MKIRFKQDWSCWIAGSEYPFNTERRLVAEFTKDEIVDVAGIRAETDQTTYYITAGCMQVPVTLSLATASEWVEVVLEP